MCMHVLQFMDGRQRIICRDRFSPTVQCVSGGLESGHQSRWQVPVLLGYLIGPIVFVIVPVVTVISIGENMCMVCTWGSDDNIVESLLSSFCVFRGSNSSHLAQLPLPVSRPSGPEVALKPDNIWLSTLCVLSNAVE